MAGHDHRSESYRLARIVLAIVLGLVAALIVVADSFALGRPVEPVILGTLLLTAAGLLAVDLPELRR